MSGQTSGSGRRKGLRRRKPEGYASEGRQALCRRTSMKPTSYGKPGKLLERQQRNYAVCRCPRSVIGRKFTKKPSYCKRAFLQKCVRSCKCPLNICFFHNTIKMPCFLPKIFNLVYLFYGFQNVHNFVNAAMQGGTA